MNNATIQQVCSIKQDAKDGVFTMHGIAFTHLVHSLIREYGYYSNHSYVIHANDLAVHDKKLILSHVVDSEEYQLATQSITYLEALFEENISYIQSLLDENCSEVFLEDMEEAGVYKYLHLNHNEIYWRR